MKETTDLNRSMKFQRLADYKKEWYQSLFPMRLKPFIHVKSASLKENTLLYAHIWQEERPPVESWV